MNIGAWTIRDGEPCRLKHQNDWVESHLESWIEREPALARAGLRWIGQQIVLPDRTRLDLLGLSPEGGLVVAELKRGRVDSGALMQALGYVIGLGIADPEWLLSKLTLADAEASEVREALTGEDGPRFSIMLIGTSSAPELERAADFLSGRGLEVPVTIVTFSSFAQDDGSVLLLRDIQEHESELGDSGVGPSAGHAVTLDGVLQLAREADVVEVFERADSVARGLGLRIKPWRKSVTVVPPFTRGRTLLYLSPASPGHVRFGASQENLASLYGADPEQVRTSLGDDWGAELTVEEALERLETFRALMSSLLPTEATAT